MILAMVPRAAAYFGMFFGFFYFSCLLADGTG
jgi:hypothetical protein